MDAQDHQNSPSSGHDSHGVHVCHKCGWPFPNPHPSAKHRRAHKRVCGKVEGYKLIDSEIEHISDDEHPSDDDKKTPSPKMEKESAKELGGSDGIGLRSSKSEDDVFSDAVTEFPESGVSPSIEERLESVGEPDKNVGEELACDPNGSQLSKGNETADKTKPVHDLTAGSEISNAEAIGSIMSQLESKTVSDIRVDEVSSGVDQTEGLLNSCSAVSETISENINTNGESGRQKELISSGPETDTDVKESVNEVESFTQSVAPDIKFASEATLCESKLEESEEKVSGPVVLESMVPEAERKIFDTLTTEPKLHEADRNTSHPVTVGKIVEQEEELNNKLQAEMENTNLEPILHEADGPETDTEAKESVNEVESSSQSVAPDIKSASEATLCESKLEEVEEKGSGSVLLESMVPEAERKTLDTSTTEAKLHEADGNTSHPVTVGKIVEQEEELNNKLQAEMENTILEPILREADGPETDTEATESVNEVESSTQSVAPDIKSASEATLCESKLEEAEEKGSGSVLLESMVPEAERKTLDTSTTEPKLHEADGNTSHPVTVGKIVEQEEALNNKLQAEMENTILEPILREADGLETDTEVKESVNEVESSTQSVAPDIKSASEATLCESKLEEAEEKCSGSVLLESMLPEAERKTLDTSTTEPKLHEADGNTSHPVTVGKIVEQEEALNNKLQAEMENTNLEPILREADGPEKDTEVKESVNEVESSTQSVAPDIKSASEATLCESKLEEAEEKGSGSVLLESMVPEAERKTLDTSTTEPKLHEADGNTSHPVTVGKIVEQEEALNNKLQAEMESVNLEPILHEADEKIVTVSTVGEVEQEEELINLLEAEKTKKDLCPQFELPKCADASVTALVEADSAKDMVGNGQLAEVYDSKVEGTKATHLLSVAEILPAIEKPEVMIGEFKDYKVLKSSFPLDIGTAEVDSSVEDDNKLTVSEPKPSSISSVPDGSLQSSTSDFNLLDHSLEKGGVLATITGEVDTSGSTINSEEVSGTKDLKGPPGTAGFKTPKCQTNYFVDGFQLNAADEESLQNGVSASSTMAHAGVIPAVSSIDEETCKQAPKSSDVENTDDNVNKKSDFVRIENGTSHSLNENNTSGAQKSTYEVYVEASRELEIGISGEVLRSGTALGVVSDLSLKDRSVTAEKQSENSNDTEEQRSIGALGAVPQFNPEDQSVVMDKNREDSGSKQTSAFPVASGISSQNSAADETGNTREAIISAPLPGEGSDKVTKEYLNISAVDNAVVSSSRTESLDGNWGSVSVVSTQSDGTGPADTEMPSSTGTEAAEKSESTILKPQTAAGDGHHKKSDTFDPPSFMTLVESGTGADEKVAASEINVVRKAEQPSEALQAGWFPSLTNVVNESDGRKKNEEIIANWSTGKQHSPLKNLLSEAHAETKVQAANQKQVPDLNQANETVMKNNGAPVTTVSSIMGSEKPNNNAAKREMEEWNSPARYPAEIKKEKKKGKPYWVPFVCCTSVHQDM